MFKKYYTLMGHTQWRSYHRAKWGNAPGPHSSGGLRVLGKLLF